MPDYRQVTRPYPGLRPFEPWEAEIFFGRDAHIDRLLEILKAQHFLAVIGPSGSGKSSLVRAGLLHSLPLGAIGTGSDWRIAIMRPGDRPIRSLAQAVSKAYDYYTPPEKVTDTHDSTSNLTASLEAELHRGPLGLVRLVEDLRKAAGDHEASLLVLIDQFEEIFTYATVGHQQANEADAFVDLLLHARDAKESRLYIVLTMRTDFLGNCVRFLKLPDAINRAQYLTPRLNCDELAAVISGPAQLFEADINPDLVVELVNSIGGDSDQLPILQHALARMWVTRSAENNSLDFTDLQGIGGLDNALTNHAEEIFEGLDPRQKVAAEWLFRAITEQRGADAGGQAVRRPRTLLQIEAWSSIPWVNFVPVLQAFANPDANFLNYKGQPGDPKEAESTVIDLSHEALIRQWTRLRNWMGAEAKAAKAAKEYGLLKDRAQAEEKGQADLLRGTELARLLEWLNMNQDIAPDWGKFAVTTPPTNPSPISLSSPTEAWASRYTQIDDPDKLDDTAKAEFSTVNNFILRSQAAVLNAQRRERTIKYGLMVLSLTCLCLASVSGWFAYTTDQQNIRVEAQSLWHPLRFSSDGQIDNIQREGLLALASAGKRQRKAFLEALRKDTNLATSFSNRSRTLVVASVGIDPNFRAWFIDMLRPSLKNVDSNSSLAHARVLGLMAVEADLNVDELLEIIAKTTDPVILKILGQSLATWAGKLEAKPAVAVATKLVQTIQKTDDYNQISALIQGLPAVATSLKVEPAVALAEKLAQVFEKTYPYESDRNSILRQGLAEVAAKLEAEPALAVATKVVQTIKDNDNYSINSNLGEGLAAAATRLKVEPAVALADSLMLAIEEPKNDDYSHLSSSQLSALGEGLAAVAARLEVKSAVALAVKLAQAIEKNDDYFSDHDSALSRGLAAVAGRLEAGPAVAAADKLVLAIEEAENDDYSQLSALGKGLAAVATRLEAGPAVALADKLILINENTYNRFKNSALGKGLAALAIKLEDKHAVVLADKLVLAIEPNNDDYSQLSALGESLAAVAGRLKPESAVALATKLAQTIEKNNKPYQISALGQGLAKVATKLEARPAIGVADRLVQLIKNTGERDQISALGKALAAVAGGLEAGSAVAVADNLVSAIEKNDEADQISTLGQGLKAVAARLKLGPAVALATKLAQAIEKNDKPYQISALGQGLAAVDAKIAAGPSVAVVAKLVQVIEKQEPYEMSALSEALAELGAKLEAGPAAMTVDKLVQSIKKNDAADQISTLGKALAALAAKLEAGSAIVVADEMKVAITSSRLGDQIAALMEAVSPVMSKVVLDIDRSRQWIELCKYPFTPREAITDAVRQANHDEPAKEKGFWAFIDWASKKFNPDLTTPIVFPPPVGVETALRSTTSKPGE